MANDSPLKSPEITAENTEKTITLTEGKGTVGNISEALGIKQKWLQEFIGNYSARPLTYIANNYNTPGKGSGKFEARYWSDPRTGDTYTLKENEDPKTGLTLIRTRGNQNISIHVPREELIPKKGEKIAFLPEDVLPIQEHTRKELAQLDQDITQTA